MRKRKKRVVSLILVLVLTILSVVQSFAADESNDNTLVEMTVEGYMTLLALDSGDVVGALMVADGWNSSVRYLNYHFDDWDYLLYTKRDATSHYLNSDVHPLSIYLALLAAIFTLLQRLLIILRVVSL